MGQDLVTEHEPVMAKEVVSLFRPLSAGVLVDATFGGGGHTRALLEALPAEVRILAFDRDPEAVARARGLGPRVRVIQGNFRHLEELLESRNIAYIAGAFFDLGLSSPQVDEGRRGFSYRKAGPLDMRMGPDAATTADEIVNRYEEKEIARILRRFGEERFAARIAAAIVAARPVRDTIQLAEVVAAALPAPARRVGHPARRTFQALRIAVNEELDAVRSGLEAALTRLEPGGRCAVISYHSLEDRLVKRRFVRGTGGCTCPPELPVCACGATAELRLLTRKPLRPTSAEVEGNPRARSARLRAVEKLAA